MPADGIPESVRLFLFESVDSVEQLEVLLLLRERRGRALGAREISDELRAHPTSIGKRLAMLRDLELVAENGSDPITYHYEPRSESTSTMVDALAEAYKTRKHKVLELIFSPTKRARSFAEAFKVRGPAGKSEGDDG